MDSSSEQSATSSPESGVIEDFPLRRRPRHPEAFTIKEFRGRLYIAPKFLDLSIEAASAAIDYQDNLNIRVDDVSGINSHNSPRDH